MTNQEWISVEGSPVEKPRYQWKQIYRSWFDEIASKIQLELLLEPDPLKIFSLAHCNRVINKMPGSGETLPHDEDHIEVRVDSGETVRVRRRTLMHSPVIRDAFSIHSNSTPKVLPAGSSAQKESTSSNDAPIDLGGSAEALKWLTGLLEATPLNELGRSANDKLSAPPSIRPLQEAIGLADKLDIPFYKNLVLQAMYSLAKQGKYQAISAYNIGCTLGDIDLARSAVVAMVGLPPPLKFSRTEVQDMSIIAWSMLHEAWRHCGSSFNPDHLSDYCNAGSWKGTQAQWLDIAAKLRFEA